jgi:hypothetical protein
MRNLSIASGGVAAIAFMAAVPNAVAEEVAKFVCQAIGPTAAPEKLGDRRHLKRRLSKTF